MRSNLNPFGVVRLLPTPTWDQPARNHPAFHRPAFGSSLVLSVWMTPDDAANSGDRHPDRNHHKSENYAMSTISPQAPEDVVIEEVTASPGPTPAAAPNGSRTRKNETKAVRSGAPPRAIG